MIRLYHGSTVTVRKPSLRPGRSNADFGKGFTQRVTMSKQFVGHISSKSVKRPNVP